MVGTYTYLAYASLMIVGSGYWYMTSRRPRRHGKESQRELRERAKAAQKEKDAKARKLKSTGENSGNEAQRRVKTKKEEVEPTITTYDDTPDEKIDNLEFAKQLSNAKTGTSMAPRSETGSRHKSVKLSKAMATKNDEEMKNINAERGSDGDDDLSSAASPEFNATTPKSGDVSDMLENTTSGPSILKLTEPTSQPAKSKKAAPKPKEPELTQKQRQNRAKKEQERAVREEAEKERRKLEEQQRRRAREAEGRSAKDGSSTIYTPPPPKTSAWDNPTKDTSTSVNKSENVRLLETFTHATDGAGPESHETQGNGATSRSLIDDYAGLGSEEDQIKLINDAAAEWNEVKAKKSRGKLVKKAPSEVTPAGNTNGTSKFDNFEAEA